MKKIQLLIFVVVSILFCNNAKAQYVMGNEWINYNQKYYKFSVVANKIHRIKQAVLATIPALSNLQGSQFQLIRDGQEVPIFVSTNGTFGSNDYIEFYGQQATGNLDAELMYNPKQHVNPNINLMYDSAYYFLTFNNSTTNKRIMAQANIISSPPAKEDYCLDTIQNYYRNRLSLGQDYDLSVDYAFYSSQIDYGEGFAKSHFTNTSDVVNYTLINCYKNSGSPDILINANYVGQENSLHNLKVNVNNVLKADSSFPYYETKKINTSFPAASIPTNNILKYESISYNNSGIDRVGLSYLNITYPKLFNSNNATFDYFELDAKPSTYYLECTNLNIGGLAPTLYDITNNYSYIGDISVTGKIRFQLPATTTRNKYMLVSQVAGSKTDINYLREINFINLNTIAAQGDFVILYSDSIIAKASTNSIQDYADYRASANGGSHKVSQISVEQIYEQFGWGYTFHATGIRRFLNYIKTNWTNTPPEYLYIIGKGLTQYNFVSYNANKNGYFFNNVTPTYGEPGSDILLADITKDGIPDFAVGRLSAFDMADVTAYLNKLIEYEALKNKTVNTIEESIWKKRVLHIAGGNVDVQSLIVNALNIQEKIITKSNFGAKITTIKKNSTNPIDLINSASVDSLVNTGINIIQFFGHSSAEKFEYALNEVSNYNNDKGRYSVLLANGCDAGDIFYFNSKKALTEKFISYPNKGSIAFIGSVNSGYIGFLDPYTDTMYNQFLTTNTTRSLAQQMRYTINQFVTTQGYNKFMRIHTEQIQLNGDPALKLMYYNLPDYAIEENYIKTIPAEINTTLDSFKLESKIFNIGSYKQDSIVLTLKRSINGVLKTTNSLVFAKGIANDTTVYFTVNINKLTDKGLNKFELFIDAYNSAAELNELNNIVIKNIDIQDEDMMPVWPYNYSIVYNNNLQLIGSTFNPFTASKKYIIQIDTTKLFNSNMLQQTSINTIGGSVTWTPTITMYDSVVYYWRTAKDTIYGNTAFNWSNSSFIYLANGSSGWNQSHYFQYIQNNFNKLKVNSNRQFAFDSITNKIRIFNAMQFNPAPNTFSYNDFSVIENNDVAYTSGCAYNVMHFVIVDPKTGLLIHNVPHPTIPNEGLWGSKYCVRESDKFFEFNFNTPAARLKIQKFIDSIPSGYYAAIYPHIASGGGIGNKIFAKQYASDTIVNGTGNSLYHKLKTMGFTYIDSFYKNRAWIFWFQKDNIAKNQSFLAPDSNVQLSPSFFLTVPDTAGKMSSVTIGPASKWNTLKRLGYANDNINTDFTTVDIYGIDSLKNATFITSVFGNDSLIDFIDAKLYPYLQLVYNNNDSITHSAQQLHYWRVLYDPVTDLALCPNINFTFENTYQQGQQVPFTIAVKNISAIASDSTRVNLFVRNAQQNIVQNQSVFLKKLNPFENTNVTFNINTTTLLGNNLMHVNVNPNYMPNEQTFANNAGYKAFAISGDKINPLLDVTFDGIHILRGDIVSASPFIKVKLKDENKYLRLDDTSLFEVKLTRPNLNASEQIYFDNNIMKFVPATTTVGTENSAYINYTPKFNVNGDYLLEVKAKDKSGNSTGETTYKTMFRIETKTAISNLLNYPNPFTSETKFIFTLTGDHIPDNMKIQIFSATGKVVREITRSELGPLHIGRNITEYAWNGTDQFGAELGNGVYFYKFVVSDKGDDVIKFTNATGLDKIEKYFKHNMGKLVIMR
jgi:Peptidase family C25